MKRFCLAFFLCVCLFPPANAAAYTVAHDATWPPFEFMDPNGKVAGYSVDYIKAVAKESGFSVRNIHVPWDGIFARLAQGDYDIVASSVTITEERKHRMDFSLPYFQTTQLLLLQADNPAASPADLKDMVIGVQTGTVGQKVVNQHKNVIAKLFDEIVDAVEQLAEGKLGGVVCDKHVAGFFFQDPAWGGKIKLAPFPITDQNEYYGFAVKKGNETILKKINAGIKALKEKRIDKEIYTKWFGEDTFNH